MISARRRRLGVTSPIARPEVLLPPPSGVGAPSLFMVADNATRPSAPGAESPMPRTRTAGRGDREPAAFLSAEDPLQMRRDLAALPGDPSTSSALRFGEWAYFAKPTFGLDVVIAYGERGLRLSLRPPTRGDDTRQSSAGLIDAHIGREDAAAERTAATCRLSGRVARPRHGAASTSSASEGGLKSSGPNSVRSPNGPLAATVTERCA